MTEEARITVPATGGDQKMLDELAAAAASADTDVMRRLIRHAEVKPVLIAHGKGVMNGHDVCTLYARHGR